MYIYMYIYTLYIYTYMQLDYVKCTINIIITNVLTLQIHIFINNKLDA